MLMLLLLLQMFIITRCSVWEERTQNRLITGRRRAAKVRRRNGFDSFRRIHLVHWLIH